MSVAVVSAPSPASTSSEGVPNWAIFSVDVLVKNQSDVAVQIPGSGPALERETQAGSWPIVVEMVRYAAAGQVGSLDEARSVPFELK